MMELPETITIGKQVSKVLEGRTITDVLPPMHLHKFTFFNATLDLYREMLVGRCIMSAEGCGIFVDVRLDDDVFLSVFDGINMKYGDADAETPHKYQMLLTFDDDTFVHFTTSMYGGIYVFRNNLDNKYRTLSLERMSPLNDNFDESYFERLIAGEKKDISAKALLATELRIPDVGNGVLQDLLFNAGIAPKCKMFSLSDLEKSKLFHSLKSTLRAMIDSGGRDTETDFFGDKGQYACLLSKNTYKAPVLAVVRRLEKRLIWAVRFTFA